MKLCSASTQSCEHLSAQFLDRSSELLQEVDTEEEQESFATEENLSSTPCLQHWMRSEASISLLTC